MERHGHPAIRTKEKVPKKYRGVVMNKQRKSNNNCGRKSIEMQRTTYELKNINCLELFEDNLLFIEIVSLNAYKGQHSSMGTKFNK